MSLRRVNNFISGIVIILGLYICFAPFLPQIVYWLKDKSPEVSAPYAGELAAKIGSTATAPLPNENRIVIPSIQLNEPILESKSIAAIKDGGTWRRPNTSDPTKGGNTVIVGHRFYGNNVATFYHLDKLQMGDKMALYWGGKELLYEVTETKVVEPEEVSIESPTEDARLTLYTCTPLWTAKQRLVIIAHPTN